MYFVVYVVYLTILFSNSDYTSWNERMIVNDELKRIWNGSIRGLIQDNILAVAWMD
jgi:hypothetical protein